MSLTVTRVPWPVPPLHADLDLLSLAIDNVLGERRQVLGAGSDRCAAGNKTAGLSSSRRGCRPGIPAGDPSTADELARAQNARDVTGSGIGLTLVATVMRHHGGDVSIRSAEGAGNTTLRFRIRR